MYVGSKDQENWKIGEDWGISSGDQEEREFLLPLKDTAWWDKEKKKRVRVSEYIGRIAENDLIKKNRRSI